MPVQLPVSTTLMELGYECPILIVRRIYKMKTIILHIVLIAFCVSSKSSTAQNIYASASFSLSHSIYKNERITQLNFINCIPAIHIGIEPDTLLRVLTGLEYSNSIFNASALMNGKGRLEVRISRLSVPFFCMVRLQKKGADQLRMLLGGKFEVPLKFESREPTETRWHIGSSDTRTGLSAIAGLSYWHCLSPIITLNADLVSGLVILQDHAGSAPSHNTNTGFPSEDRMMDLSLRFGITFGPLN